jgi:hypothetical protein
VKGKIERTRSIASVNREVALLARIFSLAQKKGEIGSNPMRQVKPIKKVIFSTCRQAGALEAHRSARASDRHATERDFESQKG